MAWQYDTWVEPLSLPVGLVRASAWATSHMDLLSCRTGRHWFAR